MSKVGTLVSSATAFAPTISRPSGPKRRTASRSTSSLRTVAAGGTVSPTVGPGAGAATTAGRAAGGGAGNGVIWAEGWCPAQAARPRRSKQEEVFDVCVVIVSSRSSPERGWSRSGPPVLPHAADRFPSDTSRPCATSCPPSALPDSRSQPSRRTPGRLSLPEAPARHRAEPLPSTPVPPPPRSTATPPPATSSPRPRPRTHGRPSTPAAPGPGSGRRGGGRTRTPESAAARPSPFSRSPGHSIEVHLDLVLRRRILGRLDDVHLEPWPSLVVSVRRNQQDQTTHEVHLHMTQVRPDRHTTHHRPAQPLHRRYDAAQGLELRLAHARRSASRRPTAAFDIRSACRNGAHRDEASRGKLAHSADSCILPEFARNDTASGQGFNPRSCRDR